jgi:hypothetical protein
MVLATSGLATVTVSSGVRATTLDSLAMWGAILRRIRCVCGLPCRNSTCGPWLRETTLVFCARGLDLRDLESIKCGCTRRLLGLSLQKACRRSVSNQNSSSLEKSPPISAALPIVSRSGHYRVPCLRGILARAEAAMTNAATRTGVTGRPDRCAVALLGRAYRCELRPHDGRCRSDRIPFGPSTIRRL